MSSIFKKNKHKAPKPYSLIQSISSMSYGDDVDALPTLVTSPKRRARKSPKVSRVSATGRCDLATMPISSSSMGSSSSASDRPANSTADCTSLLMQDSGSRDSNKRLPIPTSADSGTESYSRETSLDVPPSTPFLMDNPPAIFVSDVDLTNALLEGIAYDVVLASTLHNLGMTWGTKYRDIPATRTPPNSPTAIQEGGFGSLMGVSMAIMEGGT